MISKLKYYEIETETYYDNETEILTYYDIAHHSLVSFVQRTERN